jgi:serine phosphatase RsbU (regulator of sigma subunit)
MAWLVALDGGFSGKRFALETTFLVGRGPFNHAVLDDTTISRQHAKISPEGGGHVVYDLGSANGTFVNDQAVKRQPLRSGDVVRFGPFRFRFESSFTEDLALRQGPGRAEEVTRVGMAVPSKILGEADAREAHTFIATGGLAELEESERRLRTLFSFVHAIAATLDGDALLDLIVKNLFEAFPQAAVASIYLLDEPTGAMATTRAVARGGAKVDPYPMPAELYTELVKHGKALLSRPFDLEFLSELSEGATIDAVVMHAPMVYRGAVLGVLNVKCDSDAEARSRRAPDLPKVDTPYFVQGDLDLLAALASHTGIALANARFHRESLNQQRLQRDLAVAQQIQKSFLPLTLPRPPGVSFAADYRPALAVGGDFYDVFWLSGDRIGCTIGDVSGKGVAAALLMARVSSDLRTSLLLQSSPAAALAAVNRELCARGQSDIFVTAVALVLDVPTRTVTLSNAGHMPPYVRGYVEGALQRIDAATSPPLGLFEAVEFAEASFPLAAGDALVLTTDGVHEATSPSGQQLGLERVEAALASGSSDTTAVVARLDAVVRAHASGAAPYDDLTVLVIGVERA